MPSSPPNRRLTDSFAIMCVDGEVLADVAKEIEEADRPQPVDVVDHSCGVGSGAEIEKAFELPPDALRIGLDLLERQQISLGTLAARITDEAGTAADQCDGRMTGPLQPRKVHERHQVADVKARGGGIESDVRGDPFTAQRLFQAFALVVHQATPLEFFEYTHDASL